MTNKELAIAAQQNQALTYAMMRISVGTAQWEYWAAVHRQAGQEIEIYLTWLIYGGDAVTKRRTRLL